MNTIDDRLDGLVRKKLEGMRCSKCKHWTVPAWELSEEWSGSGTCYLRSHQRDKRLPILLQTNKPGTSIITHETFGCIMFEEKNEIHK